MERFDPTAVAWASDDDAHFNALFDALDVETFEDQHERYQAPRSAPPKIAFETALKASPIAESDVGTWLDENLHLLGKPGANLKEVVLLSLEDIERSRPGRRRRLGWRRSNFEKRVECILANALRAHFYRLSDRVSYSRGADFYRRKPFWMSGDSMRKTVDLMNAADLLAVSLGTWSGNPGSWEGTSSTFWPSEDLTTFACDYGVTADHIGKRPSDVGNVIRMRGVKDLHGKAPELPVEPTAEIARSADLLDRFNRFAAKFDVSADLTEDQTRSVCESYERNRRKHDRQPGMKRLELFNRSLTRIFNDGTFEHGGRLYGAFWTYVPSWFREYITIEDEPTVELDYAGLSIRMIYHLRGINYRDDPYEIPELQAYALEQGKDGSFYRDSVKRLVQALLNDEDEDGHPEAVKLDQTFRPRFTRAEVKSMIERKHAVIADAFRTGEGKRNQRKESDLALDIIDSLMSEGILALPIHDSFIVQKAHKDRLKEVMVQSYRSTFGFEPIIKE